MHPGKEGWLITSAKGLVMIKIQETTIKLDSKTGKTSEIAQELNDIKLILLTIACKLGEKERRQLVNELSDISSESISQWVENLKLADRN